ncbi:MAG: MFS transporter [Nitrososphaerota archaeon]
MENHGRLLFKVFITLGIVSLLADITYEGARSLSGTFLNYLSAPVIAAGLLAVGELISYMMRFVGGLLTQRTRSPRVFWTYIFIGYAVNFAIPFLALTGNWLIVLMLFFIERSGKGLRTPIRDVLLAEVSEKMGKGKGFGVHELLDQIGAIVGPLSVSIVLASYGDNLDLGFKYSFLLLGLPVVFSLLALSYAKNLYPTPRVVLGSSQEIKIRMFRDLGRPYWIYLTGSFTTFLGFIYWGFISYYLGDLANIGLISVAEVAVLYTIAMASDALVALPLGYLYDRYGLIVLQTMPISTIFIPILLFLSPTRIGVYVAAFLWGLAMSCTETVMKASVADIVLEKNRPIAYGLFNMIYGLAWFTSSTLYSILYQIGSTYYIMITALMFEVFSMMLYTILMMYGKKTGPTIATL